jgi:Icc protein
MPIYLGPRSLSRRQFLSRSLAAASGVLFAPSLFAARKRVARDVFALVSDTHIAQDRALQVRGTNMAENLQRVVTDILNLPQQPATLFHTGDCAYNTGRPGDYAAFAEMVEPLRERGIPLHVGLGNHDERETFSLSAAKSGSDKSAVADKQALRVETPKANWFLLDSLEKTNVTPGLLGRQQLDWLANTLDANRKKPALVLVHHNPGISGNMGLKDTVAFFEVIRPRKQVKAYIFGHTHTWKLDQDQSGIHLVNLPAAAYVFNSQEPSGWVRAELLRDGMNLELHCVDQARKDHLQRVSLHWRS